MAERHRAEELRAEIARERGALERSLTLLASQTRTLATGTGAASGLAVVLLLARRVWRRLSRG